MEAERCPADGGRLVHEPRLPSTGSARPRVFTKREAWQITGGLSRTTKMPCHSWGLPASSCTTGSRLREVAGSVCHDCYAHKGAYRWSRVQRAYERRLAHAEHPEWAAAMAALVAWQAARNGEPYFRWFDSGDLQSASTLEQIVAVARATPKVRHWLPTKEHAWVRQYLDCDQPPENLTIRLSAYAVDEPPPTLSGLPTTTVHRFEPAHGVPCPAYDQHPARCGPCRDCWDPSIPNVSYPYH